jgi:hypothetical protein
VVHAELILHKKNRGSSKVVLRRGRLRWEKKRCVEDGPVLGAHFIRSCDLRRPIVKSNRSTADLV